MLANRDKNPAGKTTKRKFDAKATRSLIDNFMAKAFHPESLPKGALDRTETALFISAQCQKLRCLAHHSDNEMLAWFIEQAYYQAYAVGYPKQKKSPYETPPIS